MSDDGMTGRGEGESDASDKGKSSPVAQRPKPRQLPPWKVLLHNDEENEMELVVETIMMLTPLDEPAAIERMLEAHDRGISLLLSTHQERAELYVQQFGSRNLTVTAEPGD